MKQFWTNRWLHLALLVVLGILCYSNTFNVPFQFDDVPNISANPIIKDLSYFANPSAARKFTGFAEYPALKSRYIGHLSFALNWLFGGSNVAGFHAVNIVVHILSALLIYAMIILTFRTPFMEQSRIRPYAVYVALFAASLFVAHPVQTQAVTFIVQRLASMSAMFYLASLVCYVYSRLSAPKGKKAAFYVLALLFAILGMKTKENVFTLPVAIALCELFFFQDSYRKRIALLFPFGLTMLIVPLTLISIDTSVQGLMGDIAEATRAGNIETSRVDYLMTETRVLLTYLRLIFVPLRQHLLYDYPVYSSILNPNVLLSILIHAGFISLGIYLVLKSRVGEPALRLIALGIFWFYLTLSVESTLVPLFIIYEHRVYLPSAGLFTVISAGAFLYYASLDSMKGRRLMAAGMVIIVLLLGSATFSRNFVWQSEQSLWEDNVRKAPGNAKSRASLGDVYALQGRYAEAAAQYQAALAIDPKHIGATVNLANIYLFQGQDTVAIELYKKALELNPYQPETYNNLGFALMETGQTRQAARYYQAAIDLDPRSVTAHVNLGKALFALNDREGALQHLREALKLDPTNTEAFTLLNTIQTVR